MRACPKCNKQYDDTWAICLVDNAALSNSAGAPADLSSAASSQSSSSPNIVGPVGTGGWLGLFIVGSTIGAAISAVQYIYNFFIVPRSETGLYVFFICGLLLATLQLITAYQLHTMRPHAVVLAKAFMCLYALEHIFLFCIFIQWPSTRNIMDVGISSIFSKLLAGMVWFIYFMVSKRVKNTYA